MAFTATPVKTTQLDKGWEWKQRDPKKANVLEDLDGWRNATSFPSEVHVELLKAGLIPDPYVGFNEHDVQWIGEVEWMYKSTFELAAPAEHDTAVLTFEGLDTLCDVYLNGELLFSADNQFRTWKHTLPLSSPILSKSSNTLVLHFKSAKLHAQAEEAKYGRVRAGSTNLGDPSRVYLRKAQYDWRWDWGPELMTCGPFRPITLTTYTAGARLAEVHPRATLVENGAVPKLSVDITLDSKGSAKVAEGLKVKVGIHPHDSNAHGRTTQAIREEVYTLNAIKGATLDVAKWEFRDGEVKPWWPVGHGDQNLYDVVVQLLGSDGNVLDTATHRVGFRTVSLIQEPLQEADQYGKGTTFLFEVNGFRIFSGGSNWIPADNFLTTISPDRYRRWLTLVRDGNQNMVRIWGGGIFEPSEFYSICDAELGLLVWHDFMFACGIYPGTAQPAFIESVKAEAEGNVKRLRHHPCIALWCGNNEDYQQVLQWDLKPTTDEEVVSGVKKEEKDRLLPAWVLYEEVLPNVVKAVQGEDVPYWPGSPYGGKGWDTSDPTTGDVHQWDLWGGKELPWQDYEKRGGRFISEFGIPSFPSMDTIKYWVGCPGAKCEDFSQSPVMAQHNRAGSHERRFAIVMNDNFKLTSDLESHAFLTQVMQSEAVSFAYRSWRRGWKGRGKEYTSGVLVWQTNDCWPVTSWAIIDYFLRPKPVYYSIARSLAPISVSITRRVHKNRPTDRPIQFYEFGAFQEADTGAELEVWALNGTLEPRKVQVEMWYFDLEDPKWSEVQTSPVIDLAPNQSTEAGMWKIPAPPSGKRTVTRVVDGEVKKVEVGRTHSVVAHARLVAVAGQDTPQVLARFTDWPQPYRYYTPADPGLEVKVEGVDKAGDEVELKITVQRPVKCLWLSAEGGTHVDQAEGDNEIHWSDNALEVVPGDARAIVLRNLKGWKRARKIPEGKAKVEIRGQWLGREKYVVLRELELGRPSDRLIVQAIE